MVVMTDETTVIWSQVLDQIIEDSASPDHASSILNAAKIEHIDDSSLILSFPTALMKSGVDRSYVEKIKDAFFGLTGHDISVTTIVDVDRKNSIYEQPQQSYVYPAVQEKVLETPSSSLIEKDTGAIAQPFASSSYGTYTKKLTFDTFVVGESNKLAYSGARAVAERPGHSYNPLFIYGRSGLGKTHLLCAIENYINETRSQTKVLYCQAKGLLDDLISMNTMKDWSLFDKKYYASDVLLIDDIQFLEGKEESMERIFQLLQNFIVNDKEIIISADRSPKEIDMDERITSRFMCGLTSDIQPPSFEMKLGIIKNYHEREIPDIPLSDDVLTYIAKISSSNIREIEGGLLRISSYYSLGGEITLDNAKDILKDYFPDENSKRITIKLIQAETEKFFDITHEELICAKRDRRINVPRQIAMFLCRDMTDESYPSIGKKFGGRDHSTVMNGVRNVETQMKENKVYYDKVERLRQTIKEKA